MGMAGKNTGVGCHAFLQEIFWTQGSSLHLLCLLLWQASSLPVALPGKPIYLSVYISVYTHTHTFQILFPYRLLQVLNIIPNAI